MPHRMTTLYDGDAPCPLHGGPNVTEDEKKKVISNIQAMYDAGIPFFTKETLQDVHDQLQNISEFGEKVSVKCIDDNIVELEIKTRLTLIGRTPVLEPFLCIHISLCQL